MAYLQVTLAQLRGLVQDRLGNAALTYWRTDEYNISIIQPALRLFNLLTGFWKTRALFNTVVGQVWYPLPSSLTSNLRVSWRDFPLSQASFQGLDFGRAAWENETSTSGGDVPTQPKVWAPGALNLIAIWPADGAGSNSLIVDGIAATPILTSDTSFVDIGQEELKGLLDCCHILAVFKQGGKEFEDALEMFKRFLKSAGERNAMLLASTIYRKFLGMDESRKQKPYKKGERLGAR